MPASGATIAADAAATSLDVAITEAIPSHLAGHQGVAEFVAARRAEIAACADVATRARDVAIAAACAVGDPAALAAIETELARLIGPLAARWALAGADRDEVLQRARVALFVSADGQRGIDGYRGRGPLGAYLRVVLASHALRHQQRQGREQPTDAEALEGSPVLAGTNDDPVSRAEASALFKAAFAAALAELEPRERTLLRQHYVDGASAETLARLHQVHRATTTRWLEAARATLFKALRRELHGRGVSRDAVDSLVGGLASRIDLSLSRLLPLP